MALCVAHRVKKSWATNSSSFGNELQFSRLRTAVLSATNRSSLGYGFYFYRQRFGEPCQEQPKQ